VARETVEMSAAQVRRRINRAYFELMAIAVSDVESAHGFITGRRLPSLPTLDIYDSVVRALEAQADAEAAFPKGLNSRNFSRSATESASSLPAKQEQRD
jgi:hypothetical protein